MFKSVSSWSSAQNITCTPHGALSSLSSAGGLVLVGTGASKDLSGRVCGGSNSMCCTLARFVDRRSRRFYHHEAWQKNLRSLMTFCHSQTTQPSWSACTVRYSKSGSRTEPSLISAGKRQSLEDWGEWIVCCVDNQWIRTYREMCWKMLERLKEVANSSVIPSENSERPHFWQEHCPFESR